MFRFFTRVWFSFKEYIVLVVLIIVSFVVLSLNQKPEVKNFRAIAFGSFAAVTSVVSDLINIANIKSENRQLREVNAELMLQVNRLREYGIQNEELRNLLKLKDTLKYPLIPAAIVSKSFSKIQGTITINAGLKDGVKPGMPVINDEGLVGVVYNSSEDYSIARTLKNFDLKITVKDQRSRIDGIMKWNGENLVIINVPKTYDVEPGDRIITSDISSIIPVPLPVGVVTGLSNIKTGIFNEVKVKPFVDFLRVENVFVLGIVESKQIRNLEMNFYKRNEN
ncbi:MAG: rod shape-determining protein MreC [Ignavibacteriaceae bacterium]|jgi:rod shape-determining protein MreC